MAQRVVSARAIHDLSKQRERRIPRQFVFLQNRLERTFLAVVTQFHGWYIKGHCSEFLRLAHHLLRRNKMKFRLRVHKVSDQRGARHSIDFYIFTRDPLHTHSSKSLQLRCSISRSGGTRTTFQKTSSYELSGSREKFQLSVP